VSDLDQAWASFCARGQDGYLPPEIRRKVDAGMSVREATRIWMGNILRVLEQGPIEDPCDPQWNEFVKEIRNSPEWPRMLREAKECRKSGGILDNDLFWTTRFNDQGELLG
jgi:hypothetical protein